MPTSNNQCNVLTSAANQVSLHITSLKCTLEGRDKMLEEFLGRGALAKRVLGRSKWRQDSLSQDKCQENRFNNKRWKELGQYRGQ